MKLAVLLSLFAVILAQEPIPEGESTPLADQETTTVESEPDRETTPIFKGRDDPFGGEEETTTPQMFLDPETTVAPTTAAPETCTDELKPESGRNACFRSRHLCRIKRYSAFMKENCAKTCGYCSGNESPVCQDQSNTCPNYKRLCRHRRAGTFLRTNCPLTCGMCTPTNGTRQKRQTTGEVAECKDIAVRMAGQRCYQATGRCDQPVMQKYCAATCGYCVDLAPKQCRDKFVGKDGGSQCSKALCGVKGREDLKQYIADTCPVTCGLCDPATGQFN